MSAELTDDWTAAPTPEVLAMLESMRREEEEIERQLIVELPVVLVSESYRRADYFCRFECDPPPQHPLPSRCCHHKRPGRQQQASGPRVPTRHAGRGSRLP